MTFAINRTTIPGCFEIFPLVVHDQRGIFVKLFHEQLYSEHGLATHFAEIYYSVSHQGVLRGLHFQSPPMDHSKIVSCISGEVMDTVVDLRKGSPTYGKYATFQLSSEKGNLIYIPSGLAHGFYVQSRSAILLYNVTTVYSPQHDSGVRWDTVGIPWPNQSPIVSERDSNFTAVSDFESPFKFHERQAIDP